MDNEPPISKHEFYDRFHQRVTSEKCMAAHGGMCSNHDAVDRIPQKKGLDDIITNSRPQFWGIVAREQRSGVRMLIYFVVSSLSGLAFFFSWLFILEKDSLQDAATLLLTFFNLLGLLLTAQVMLA